MTIRPVAAADLDRIHEINEANVPAVSSVDRGDWDELVAMCALALVAEADEAGGAAIAGFCLLLGPGTEYGSVNYRWFMERFDDAMYLDRVAFDPDQQGRGLGRRLYAEVERRLVADFSHLRRLTLEVNVDPPNPQSMAFHSRLGFTEIGRQTTDYGCVVSLMHRPLPPSPSSSA